MAYFDEDWAPRFGFGGPRTTSGISRIVIHTTENSAGTPAANVANYQLTSETGSYHMLVDTTGRRLRENTEDWVTWSTGNNEGNVCGLNLSFVFYSAYTRAQWLAQEKMLRAGATVCAYWAKTYGIPVVKTDGTARGFCGHGDLRRYGGTDHQDPGGNFPWDVFLAYVKQAMGATPTTVPSPTAVAAGALSTKFFTDFVTGYLGPVISDVKDVRQQITGGRDAGDYRGWSTSQLVRAYEKRPGDTGTIPEMIAVVLHELQQLRADVDELKKGLK